jgi:hypothetical protein
VSPSIATVSSITYSHPRNSSGFGPCGLATGARPRLAGTTPIREGSSLASRERRWPGQNHHGPTRAVPGGRRARLEQSPVGHPELFRAFHRWASHDVDSDARRALTSVARAPRPRGSPRHMAEPSSRALDSIYEVLTFGSVTRADGGKRTQRSTRKFGIISSSCTAPSCATRARIGSRLRAGRSSTSSCWTSSRATYFVALRACSKAIRVRSRWTLAATVYGVKTRGECAV